MVLPIDRDEDKLGLFDRRPSTSTQTQIMCSCPWTFKPKLSLYVASPQIICAAGSNTLSLWLRPVVSTQGSCPLLSRRLVRSWPGCNLLIALFNLLVFGFLFVVFHDKGKEHSTEICYVYSQHLVLLLDQKTFSRSFPKTAMSTFSASCFVTWIDHWTARLVEGQSFCWW